MTPQLGNAIAIAKSLCVSEQRELINILSNLLNESEDDPSVEEVAASLQRALHEVKTGQTKPISQLWDSLDGE
ncbi:hypothetical protein [Leptolyngbya sp. FACHB-17]|uniref:hypothetical protein n=1 Tax=unclassified Leptolyngbya TaxID=2650499 RepID=UPI001681447C|nr:hypothetical protein [Leptolyngbya sp. FACHB-17]MBD2081673.1 hypothetical protein [Leptolyngbya sp. FACHB-17]